MTNREFTQLAIQKFSNLSTEKLMNLAKEFNDEILDSDTATCKLDAVLLILSKRIPMEDLIKFCENLYEI